MNIGEARFRWEPDGESVCITGVFSREVSLRIPDEIDGKNVSAVGKKAFWGCESVREAVLPDTLLRIGDWAFASCKNLVSVSMPDRQLSLGRGVFRGCDALRKLEIRGKEDIAYLLAAGDKLLENPYLLDIRSAGSREWYEKWDAALLKRLQRADDEGFSKMLLCGEEDYGSKENDHGHYCGMQRKIKARIALLRLRYDTFLDAELRGMLISFLTDHAKGCKNEEAWEVVKDEYGEERDMYEMFYRIGGIREDNLERCIEDLGESHSQMKAYLLGNRSGGNDFFDALDL